MKNNIVRLIISALLICLCGISVCAAAEGPAVTAGVYTLVSIEISGETMDPGAMSMSSVLTLNEDGTGLLDMNGMEMELPKWTAEEGTLTVYNVNGDALECSVKDGIISLEMGTNYYWNYSAEDPNAGKPASLLSQFLDGIDAESGAHLNYEYHSDYMDSTSVFDVHARNDSYYSLRTTKVSGYEDVTATAFLNGTAYTLYPDKMRGSAAITVSSALLGSNVLMLDECYKAMFERAKRKDFSVETREIDGKPYTAEVFPRTAYSPEAAFYFDDAGRLCHILVEAPEAMPKLGQTFFTIHSADDAVDDSLFDITGYTIE